MKDKLHRMRFWELMVKGNVIYTSNGIVDGKVSSSIEEEKNDKVALKKSETLIQNQLDKGYSQKPTNDINIMPMLAQSFEKGNMTRPCFAQPKLDGVRMIVGKDLDGNIVCKSRTGKQIYQMEHVKEEVILKPGQFLDGEVFTFSESFETITGICKTQTETSTKLFFYVFDMFDIRNLKLTFEQRLEFLNDYFVREFKYTRKVKTLTLHDDDVDDIHDAFTNEGYEGLILRAKHGLYSLGTRSCDILKYKKFVTEEYEIVNVLEATGRDVGTAVFVCKIRDSTFKVRPIGSFELRCEYFVNKDEYIGKMLTVKYQNMTSKNIPRFPVGIIVRDYE